MIHCSAAPDTEALNVQNNQRLHSMLVLNNNHSICDQDAGRKWKSSFSNSDKINLDHEFSEQKTHENVTDNPLIENLLLEAESAEIRKAEDSQSCDASLSEIDEKSEAFSFHSEAFAWSEDEKDCLDEKTEDRASSFSLVFTEKYNEVPDNSKVSMNNKHERHCTPPRYQRQMTGECSLSEIISPVDEILSYGSAELPPSVKGGATSGLNSHGCPSPPPAFEIITWTSEEELPAGHDSVEDLSINSENLPPLPVDISLKTRAPPSVDCNDLREKELSNDSNGVLCEAEDSGCLEITSTPPENVRNKIFDPLSSIQIGDRVLVCNSRPGVLKYKGLTAFANGFWVGVALDAPNGNHNGTFRGVKYFSCDKSHGVLVRADNLTHIQKEHSRDLENRKDENHFLDQDAKRNKQQKDTSSADGQWKHMHSPKDETMPTNTMRKQQIEPQEDLLVGVINLSHSSDMPSQRTGFELHHNKPNHLDAKLTEELGKDFVFCAQDTRKSQTMKLWHDNQTTDKDVTGCRKRADGHFMPCVMEPWHQAQPDKSPKIKVPTHEDGIVYRLVDAAVDILCGQANEGTLDLYETPRYLVNDDGRRRYRQVISQLTSDVLREISSDLNLRTKQSAQNVDSVPQSHKSSFTFIKTSLRKEIQKILNLEQSEQQMTRMLQKLCKYWYAKRDRVDFILIQELHNEEKTWLDYGTDQYTVKMHLTEEIFGLLLDDTILTLNRMHFSTR